jgi:hypothetical protein
VNAGARAWVCALGLGGCTLGCGSGAASLSAAEFDRLPRESRQEIFDAENDLVISHNREDDARDHRRSAEGELSRLEQRWTQISRRLSAAGQGARLPAARKVFDADAAYLGAEVQVASADIDLARVETKLSLARLILVRQRQLARIGRVAVGSLKPLEEAVTAADATFRQASTAANGVRAGAERQLEAWKTAEDDYTRTSGGDFDTVVWAE